MEPKEKREMLTLATRLAHEAGQLLKSKIAEVRHVEYKGEIDIVTDADKMAETLIISQLQQLLSTHDIISEESPATNRGSQFRWIIDPLDGTTNFAHGYPIFCVSIALEVAGVVEVGVVYNPMLDEMFSAIAGEGAFLNNERIHCSGEDSLNRSLLATGFPYDIRTNSDNNLKTFSTMAKRVRAIRRAGAAALDLAYLAAGRFEGFWELRLKPWDMAAAVLLIREAGGFVSDLRGEQFALTSPHILASNGIIHAQLLAVIQEARP